MQIKIYFSLKYNVYIVCLSVYKCQDIQTGKPMECDNLSYFLAGAVGLEPTTVGIKTRCLTNLATPQLSIFSMFFNDKLFE